MRKFLYLITFLLGLNACVGKPTPDLVGSPVNDQTALGNSAALGSPRPYQTITPAHTQTLIPTLIEIVLPTPTSITYSVIAGDTLSGIATHFGLHLDDLIAANPGISANAMPVGTVLRIPQVGNISGNPTPTPAPVKIEQARCWPTAEGGCWCFALVQNDFPETIENLAVQFTLLGDLGQEISHQVAFGLLNILPAGKEMPVATFFPAPIPADVAPRAQILSAIRLSADDTRYLPISLQNTLVMMDWTGRIAKVTGQAMPLIPERQVNTLWILGVAYDLKGTVVGLRRWESIKSVGSGISLSFEFTVSSLGPPIDRVDLLVEARP